MLFSLSIVDKAKLVKKLARYFGTWGFFYFFCSMALTVDKTQKVLKCR